MGGLFQLLWLFLSVLFTCGVMAAEITPVNKDGVTRGILISGRIMPGDRQTFANIALSTNKAIVILASEGGSVWDALEIGRAIRLKGFPTYVIPHSTCASACALIWLAGTPRQMSSTAKIGFHAVYMNTSGTSEVSSSGNAIVGSYLNALGLPEAAIFEITSASPNDMEWMTPGRFAKLGIDVQVEEYDDEPTSPQGIESPNDTNGTSRGGAPVHEYHQLFRVSSDVSEGILNMRNGPGQRHSLLTSIPAGSGDVRQIGPCVKPADDGVSKSNWCYVEWNGNVGWVWMGGLEAQGQPLPRDFPSKNATSLWDHNGSIMRLSAKGTSRIIAYERPRRGMQQVGVQGGDVLFEGTREGSALRGLARIFTPACGVLKYEVNGLVAEGDGRIELIGSAPVLDRSCKQVGTKRDFLVFEYLGRD